MNVRGLAGVVLAACSGCSLIYGGDLPVGGRDASIDAIDALVPEVAPPETGATTQPLGCGGTTCVSGEHCCWRREKDLCQATQCAEDGSFAAQLGCMSAWSCTGDQLCCIVERWSGSDTPKETRCATRAACSPNRYFCDPLDPRGCPDGRKCIKTGLYLGPSSILREFHYCE